jgi:hypothetical protein
MAYKHMYRVVHGPGQQVLENNFRVLSVELERFPDEYKIHKEGESEAERWKTGTKFRYHIYLSNTVLS